VSEKEDELAGPGRKKKSPGVEGLGAGLGGSRLRARKKGQNSSHQTKEGKKDNLYGVRGKSPKPRKKTKGGTTNMR